MDGKAELTQFRTFQRSGMRPAPVSCRRFDSACVGWCGMTPAWFSCRRSDSHLLSAAAVARRLSLAILPPLPLSSSPPLPLYLCCFGTHATLAAFFAFPLLPLPPLLSRIFPLPRSESCTFHRLDSAAYFNCDGVKAHLPLSLEELPRPSIRIDRRAELVEFRISAAERLLRLRLLQA